jgi:hypothetical protein
VLYRSCGTVEKRQRAFSQPGARSSRCGRDCFSVIEHGRRRIFHFQVTIRPSSESACNSCRRRFPRSVSIATTMIRGSTRIDCVKETGLNVKSTNIQAPWQKGMASGGRKLSTGGSRPFCSAKRITTRGGWFSSTEVSFTRTEFTLPCKRKSASVAHGG